MIGRRCMFFSLSKSTRVARGTVRETRVFPEPSYAPDIVAIPTTLYTDLPHAIGGLTLQWVE
jgi:hypothetical protein